MFVLVLVFVLLCAITSGVGHVIVAQTLRCALREEQRSLFERVLLSAAAVVVVVVGRKKKRGRPAGS